MIYLSLQDKEFPYRGFATLRLTARGIVLDERGKVALHRIKRNDLFGDQEYFETPGGGVDEGETIEQALMRECREELGEEVKILCPLASWTMPTTRFGGGTKTITFFALNEAKEKPISSPRAML